MSVLEDIILGVRDDIERRKESVPLEEVKRQAVLAEPAIDVVKHFSSHFPYISLIAECKRSSPSKGVLASIDDPGALASIYEKAGASAISVLTEERRFHGSLADFDAVRANVSIPVLRKDFIVDPYQIWEARAHGADFLLLIVAALDDVLLKSYLDLIHALGMKALVEVHTEEEIERALALGAHIIGVNTRNLKTLDVDITTFERLAPFIPEEKVLVGESGVKTLEDVSYYAYHGADAVLVGESLVTSNDTYAFVQQISQVKIGQGNK